MDIDEIFLLICSYMLDVKDLIKLELLSTRHKELVRRTAWDTFTINVNSEHILEKMLSHHIFLKLRIFENATADDIDAVVKHRSWDLTDMVIIDDTESVKNFLGLTTTYVKKFAIIFNMISRIIPTCCITINYFRGFLISQPSFDKVISIEFDFTNFSSFYCLPGTYHMIINTNEFNQEFNSMIDGLDVSFYAQCNSRRTLRLVWSSSSKCKRCGEYDCNWCEKKIQCPWCLKNIFMWETKWWNNSVDICSKCFDKPGPLRVRSKSA